jgi:hypothetical protein
VTGLRQVLAALVIAGALPLVAGSCQFMLIGPPLPPPALRPVRPGVPRTAMLITS